MFGIVKAKIPLEISKTVGIKKVKWQWLPITSPMTTDPTTLPSRPIIIEMQIAIALKTILLIKGKMSEIFLQTSSKLEIIRWLMRGQLKLWGPRVAWWCTNTTIERECSHRSAVMMKCLLGRRSLWLSRAFRLGWLSTTWLQRPMRKIRRSQKCTRKCWARDVERSLESRLFDFAARELHWKSRRVSHHLAVRHSTVTSC